MIIHGNCVEKMRELEPNSVDAICTDPPYGLEFMGKEWDKLRPGALTNRGGKAPGRSKEEEGKLAPVEYGRSKRRFTMVCTSCGKRDKFTNPHKCKADNWERISLDADPKSIKIRSQYSEAIQQWHLEWSTEALRVLKPGGFLLAFGGTRTCHRLTCAIEDAGLVFVSGNNASTSSEPS